MLNKYDFKYIIKKVIIFFIIFVILSFLKITKTNAAVSPYFNNLTFPSNFRVYNLTSASNGTSISYTTNSLIGDTNFYDVNYASWEGTFASYGYALNIQSSVSFMNDYNYGITFYFGRSSNTQLGSYTTNFTNYLTTFYGWGVSGVQASVLGRTDNACIDLGSTYNVNVYGYRYLCSYSIIFKANSTGQYLFSAFNSYISGSFNETNLAFIGYDLNIIGNTPLSQADIQNALSSSFNSVNNNITSSTRSINDNIDAMDSHISSSIDSQTATITDDNVSGAESQVNDLLNNSAFQDNSGIQSIITAPLNFIQGLSNSCSPISLTIPYINTNVTIPCMKQELTNRVPTVVPILSTIINGFIIYRILIDIVAIVKTAREPDEDRIEVLDL